MERALKKFTAGLTLALALFSPARAEVAQAIGPFGGLNNTDNPLIIPANQAQDLLNVDITPGGKSAKKRKGYGLQFNLTVTTSATHGIYTFYDANGSDVSLFFHDRYLQGSVNGATPTIIFATSTLAATWQCVDSLGFAYCASSARDMPIKTNGVTYSTIGTAPLGTMVAVTPERMLIAGTSANPQRIAFSKANDFTTWTTGSAPTDPNTEDINAPGSRISHITYAFNKIIWFKDASFGAILGTDNSNWETITISPNLGTLDNTSVYRDGLLYFRGQDGHIYVFDGNRARKLTRDQGATISASSARRANQYSQTSQSDFQLGTIVPTGSLSTTISAGDVVPSSFTATDDVAADWNAGTLTRMVVSGGSIQINYNSSTTVTDNSFESGNGSTAWEHSVGAAMSTAGLLSLSGGDCGGTTSLSPKSGSLNFRAVYNSPGGGTFAVQLIDASGNVLTENTYNVDTAVCAWTQGTLSASTYAGRAGRVRIKRIDTTAGTTSYDATRSTYTIGGNITYWYAGDSLEWGLDLIEGGISSVSSGTFTSRSFDTGLTKSYVQITPSYTVNTFSPTFVLQDSTNGSSFTDVGTSTTTSHSVNRYVRYISSFTPSPIQDAKTTLDSVTLVGRSSGTYYSPVQNAPSLTSWDTLTVNKTDNGGSHSFYMRSSSNSFTVLSSTPSWTAQTIGAQISIATGTYFQVRDDFVLTFSTHVPTLSDFQVNWFEGAAGDKAYATYFDNAIWWSITSGAGQTVNNYILRYDLINSASAGDLWTLYDIGTNGMLVRNNALYFGSSSVGKIFKFGDATADNNGAINAYWKSKDFFGDSPFTEKEFRTLSTSASSIANSSMTITYTVNGSSSSSYTAYLYNPNSSFIKNNKNLPLGRNGSYFNVQFGNNAADQPFEVFGLLFTYEPKPWRPSSQ